jgi:hypothetical protein
MQGIYLAPSPSPHPEPGLPVRTLVFKTATTYGHGPLPLLLPSWPQHRADAWLPEYVVPLARCTSPTCPLPYRLGQNKDLACQPKCYRPSFRTTLPSFYLQINIRPAPSSISTSPLLSPYLRSHLIPVAPGYFSQLLMPHF